MIDVGSLSWSDLRKGIAIQNRIIGALMMREMRTRFGNLQFGYAWALIEPLIQIGILVIIFTMIGRRPPLGTSFETFFLNGYVPYSLFNQISSRAALAISSNRSLLSFPPVRNMDTVWARILLEGATGLTSLILLIGIFAYFDIPVIPNDFFEYLFGFASILALASGVGIFNAAVSPIWNSWMVIYSWFTKIQYFLCGIFFLPDMLPPVARDILAWNPVAHSIIWIRQGFYVGYDSIVLDKAYPLVIAVVLAILGLAIERVFRRSVDAK